ncbi:prolyl aminopeptidase [Prosthecomicrobium sp. N25]|uniref:prolyl aminopeptidase n=1 Tax=Prosthecomicrobium sp. N25 TaxID=3129254 RepID=UPI003076FC53
MAERLPLYPPLEPYRTGRIRVSEIHEIYYEECGNPQGKPTLLVHGGPGGGSNPTMRRLHDPAHYRIVLFDQRGCGRSTPHAELRENTTWDLVADMERLRVHLGIPVWQVVGGSWGSTLALAYAQTHPGRVTELILRGIFTLRRKELHWFYQEGADHIFPDLFAPYRALIPPDERHDMIAAYHRRLVSDDPALRLAAARAWSTWEGGALSLLPDPGRVAAFAEDSYALAFARIECHYFVNGGFFRSDGQLLEDVDRIRHIPGVIVHGRYDMCTPVFIAFDLADRWPEAELRIVPDAGHAVTEPGIVHELVTATDRFRGTA